MHDKNPSPVHPSGHSRLSYLPVPGETLALPDEVACIPGLFEIPLVRRPLGYTYVYLLCQRDPPRAPGWPDTLVLDYVGLSSQAAKRIYDHTMQREREGKPPIARAFGVALPIERAHAVEEALIRVAQPAYCRPRGVAAIHPTGAPRMRRQDVEALRWLGYPVPGGS